MNDTLLVAIVAAAATVLSGLVALAVAWVDRRSKRRAAEAATVSAAAAVEASKAAKTAAQAAAVEARAEMRRAVVAEREQASADWARYCDAQQKWNESLAAQISDNNRRINDAEMRAEAAEMRSAQSQKLYAVAIIYLRRLIDWINDNLPGESYPLPPTELSMDVSGA